MFSLGVLMFAKCDGHGGIPFWGSWFLAPGLAAGGGIQGVGFFKFGGQGTKTLARSQDQMRKKIQTGPPVHCRQPLEDLHVRSICVRSCVFAAWVLCGEFLFSFFESKNKVERITHSEALAMSYLYIIKNKHRGISFWMHQTQSTASFERTQRNAPS